MRRGRENKGGDGKDGEKGEGGRWEGKLGMNCTVLNVPLKSVVLDPSYC